MTSILTSWKVRVALACVAGSAAVAVGFFLWQGPTSVEAAAEEALAACKGEQDKEACYEKAIAPLYPELSVGQIFEVIRIVRAQDRGYQFCHLLAHQLGEEAVAENPDKWTDVVPLNPTDGMCSNGFIHGAVIGRFRDDTLEGEKLARALDDFSMACEARGDWHPTELDRAICYHGLGHLYTFITDAKLQEAAEICEKTTVHGDRDYRRVCREGVFMQIYQPVEPDDFDLIELLPEKPTKENYRRLCSVYQRPEERGACMREAWPLFRAEIFEKNDAGFFCKGQPNKEEEDACYDALTSIIGRLSLNSPEKLQQTCLGLPLARQEMCFSRAALATLEEDRNAVGEALATCSAAPKEVANACVRFLAQRAQFIFGNSTARSQFCEALPREVQQACRNAQ
ncbi:MAG: hypothetical protein KBE09_03215 [Candidatus Pacebacteria bacterium]|nr:hypothetical protein [Candidatus Paceibacterota bacterium]